MYNILLCTFNSVHICWLLYPIIVPMLLYTTGEKGLNVNSRAAAVILTHSPSDHPLVFLFFLVPCGCMTVIGKVTATFAGQLSKPAQDTQWLL